MSATASFHFLSSRAYTGGSRSAKLPGDKETWRTAVLASSQTEKIRCARQIKFLFNEKDSRQPENLNFAFAPMNRNQQLVLPKAPSVLSGNFYEALGVEKTASLAEIKKAYYILALQHHPDKSPSPESAEIFKKIGTAYHVLSDPVKRRAYDDSGCREAPNGTDLIDAKQVFRMLCGGEAFTPIIGDFLLLSLLETTHSPEQLDSPAGRQEMEAALQARMQERVESLVRSLLERISTYSASGKETFSQSCNQLAAELAKENFSKQLLKTVGYVYYVKGKIRAEKFKFMGIPSMWSAIKDFGHAFGKVTDVFMEARSVSRDPKIQQLQAPRKSITGPSEAQQQSDEELEVDKETMGKVLQLLGNVTCMEIDQAIRLVCQKVLSSQNGTIPKQEILRRCEALKILGKSFLAASDFAIDGFGLVIN